MHNAVTLLSKLISFKSLTPCDDGAFSYIKSYFPDFHFIETEKEGVKNLFLYKRFGEKNTHLCFAGHIDVVPPGNGWLSDPFNAHIENDILFGRGAADMKSGVSAFLTALQEVKEFSGTLSVLLTSDEEGDAFFGTKLMLEELQKNELLPNYCIVAEPTCESRFGDTVKVGRRGSVNGHLKLIGRGGHAAYPEKALNPVSLLSTILPNIADAQLDDGDEFFAPSRLVITDIKGGYGKHNVIPNDIDILFNVRNSTKTSCDDVQTFIRTVLHDAHIETYELTATQSSNPFVIRQQERSHRFYKTLADCIEKETGIVPQKSTAGGTSDARFIAQYNIDVLEFGVKNASIHAPNEQVELHDVTTLSRIFSRVIQSVSLL